MERSDAKLRNKYLQEGSYECHLMASTGTEYYILHPIPTRSNSVHNSKQMIFLLKENKKKRRENVSGIFWFVK